MSLPRIQRFLLSSPILLLAVIAAASCSGPSTPTPTISSAAADHSVATRPLPDAYRKQVPALSNANVLNYLPDNTFLAMVAKSPRELAAALTPTAILREYGVGYSDLAKHLSAENGTNFFEPETWPAGGIDIDKPAGVAVLVEKGPAAVFFVTLSDRALFIKTLEQIATREQLGPLRIENVGEAMILRLPPIDDFAFVVRGDAAMLVLPARGRELQVMLEKIVGSTASNLSSSGRIARAFAGFDHGKDIAGFLAFDSIAAKIIEEIRRDVGDSHWESEVSRLEAEIATAKSEGGGKELISELETELQDSLRGYNREQMRDAAEARMVTRVLAEIGTIAIGIDLDGPSTRARVQISLDPKSLPGRLFAGRGQPLALSKRLTETPLYMLGGHFNRVAVLELADTMLQMDGENRQTMAVELKSETGIDLNEALSHFAGELSGAMTLNTERLKQAKGDSDLVANSIGMHILLQLRDEERARAYLKTVSALPALKRFVVPKSEAIALDIPGFNDRMIRVEIVDGYLQARTLSDVSAPFVWKAEEAAILSDASTLASMVFDPMLFAWMIPSADHDYERARPFGANPDKPDPKLVARHAELLAEIKKLKVRRRQLQVDTFLDTGKKLGRLALSARRHEGGVAVYGGLFGESENLGRVLQSVVELIEPDLQKLRSEEPNELRQLKEKLDTLEEERWRLDDKMGRY